MRKTILVIDDEKDFLEEMKFLLGQNGYEVVTASDGEEGIATMREVTPNLVLLDISMSGTDGFDVLTEFKKDTQTACVPVIMLTARDLRNFMGKAYAMRASDYVVKPFRNGELLSLIRRYEL